MNGISRLHQRRQSIASRQADESHLFFCSCLQGYAIPADRILYTRMGYLLPALLALLLPLLTSQQCPSPDQAPVDAQARPDLYAGQQDFSFDMLRAVHASSDSTSNIFFSPSSMYNALLLAYFGSANHTEAAVKSALRIPEGQDKLSMLRAYTLERFLNGHRDSNGSASYELSSANRLFFAREVELLDCMTELFDEEIQKLDFKGAAEESRGAINTWVEEQTRRHIKELIPSGKISTATQMVLVNAAYFKGLWQSRFQLENTRKLVFFVSPTETTFTSMMKQKGSFNYMVSEQLKAEILELPYKGDAISLYIILPPWAQLNGLEYVISKLSNATLEDIVNDEEASPRPVEVSIPKFSIEQTIELTPILEKLGVGDLFQSTADLSGFTGKPGLTLDEATHKAKIELDEQGTTAAAATAMFSFRISRPLNPTRFVANHPFVYFIYDKTNKTVLFVGVFRSPKK